MTDTAPPPTAADYAELTARFEALTALLGDKPHGIHQAICNVIADLPTIGKDAEMTQGARYNYRSIEAILTQIKPLFAVHGIHAVPSYRVIVDDVEYKTNKDVRQARAVVEGTFRFCHVDGSSVTAVTIGEARDAGDKSWNKAETAAWKYALVQTFAIAEGSEDPDHFNPSHEQAPQVEAPATPSFDTLKALGPALRATNHHQAVKAWAEAQGIEVVRGTPDEDLAKVVQHATELLAGPPGEPSTTIDTPEQTRAAIDEITAEAATEAVEQAFPGTTEIEGVDQ